MKKYMAILSVLFLFIFVYQANATILFEDDFDDHSPWGPTQPSSGGAEYSNDGDSNTRCTGCPDGNVTSNAHGEYAGYRIARTGHNDGLARENTLQIDDTPTAYGGSGNSLQSWEEPIDEANCEDWCSEGLLVVYLDNDYTDVYVSYQIKFDTNWVWDASQNSGLKMGKFAQWYDGSGEFWTYFTSGNNWGFYVIDFYKETAYSDAVVRYHPRKRSCYLPNDGCDNLGAVSNDFFRYGIPESGSSCTLDTDCQTWAESLMDGSWHQVIYYTKWNSSMGTADGEFKMYIDGTLAISKTDIIYADRGKTGSCGVSPCDSQPGAQTPGNGTGFNQVVLGGNSHNEYYANTSGEEIYYQMDNLIIATTLEEALGGSDTTAPVMSNPLPSGAQACGVNPQSVTLEVTTDENATCKYDTSDTTYDLMGNTYSNTGGTGHSQVLSLACGASYTYYSRCSDAYGNKNSSSSTHSFSIETEATSQTGGIVTQGVVLQ